MSQSWSLENAKVLSITTWVGDGPERTVHYNEDGTPMDPQPTLPICQGADGAWRECVDKPE